MLDGVRLITLIGGTWLGTVLLRRGFRPRVTAVILALVLTIVIAVQIVVSLGSAFGRRSATQASRPHPSVGDQPSCQVDVSL